MIVRRASLTVLLLSLTVACAAPPADTVDLGTRRAGSDWPGFLGPLGTSVSPEKGITAPWPTQGLPIIWQRQLGQGYCAPTIANGRLYLFDRQGNQARLNCLRSETGEALWQFEYPTDFEDLYGYDGGPRCSPVVDEDRVYIYGPEGMLHCLHTTDGKLLWKVDTKPAFGVVQNFFGVGSTPVIEGDLLIAQVGGSAPGSGDTITPDLKPNGSGVVAFDKRTGMVRYKLGNELASYSGPVLATIQGRRWCFVFARGGLLGFDPTMGKEDFHFPWRARTYESVNASNPVVVDDRVLITETYGPGSALLKVKPGGYDLIWSDADQQRRPRLQGHWCTPVYHNGHIYGCSGRHTDNAELRCLELTTGKVTWREPGLSRLSLLLVDGHFVVLTELGTLLLLKANPAKYEEVSRLHYRQDGKPFERGTETRRESLLQYPCWAAPVLAHGLLYVRGKDRLVCLELIRSKR